MFKATLRQFCPPDMSILSYCILTYCAIIVFEANIDKEGTMAEEKLQTNIRLTASQRLALKEASGDPYSHGSIVGGVRALVADWELRGKPELWPAIDPVPESVPVA
jgi:hypothetical protein